jgi:predicted transcriptional regulator
MQNLTKGEEELMQYFWDYGPLKVSEMIAKMPNPKPAMTTVSTLVRILEDKGIVNHKKEGRAYRYYPILSREEYRKKSLGSLVKKYFSNNPLSLVSHLVEEKAIDAEHLEHLLSEIQKEEDGNH